MDLGNLDVLGLRVGPRLACGALRVVGSAGRRLDLGVLPSLVEGYLASAIGCVD